MSADALVEVKLNRRRRAVAVICSILALASVITTTVAVVLSQFYFCKMNFNF